ncbi:MAG: hypothetical protein PHI50_01095 [Alphaproteobacteria bacterium]|nr:hypothetical protein [Alphaproteobacteria bacterium]
MSSLFESLENQNIPSFEMKEGQTMRNFLSWFEETYPKKEDYNFVKVLSPEGVATFFPLDPSKTDVPTLLQECSEEEGYLGNVILSKDAKKGFISAEEQLQKGQGDAAEITTNTYTVSGELFTAIEVEDTEILDENGQKVSVPLAKISYDILGEKGTLTPMEANALARVEDEFSKEIDKRKNTYEMTDLMMRAVLKQVAQIKKQDKKELSFDEFEKVAENVFYSDKDVQEDVEQHIKHHKSARRLYNFSTVVVAIGRAMTLVNGGLSYTNSINTARMENGNSSQNSQAKHEIPVGQINQAEEEVQVVQAEHEGQTELEQNAPETTRFQYSSGAVRVDGELKWQYSGEINGMPFHGIMDEDPAQTAEEEADHFLSLTEKREIRRTAIIQDMQAKLGIKTQEASIPSNVPEATISAPETAPELVAEEAAVAAAPVQAEQTEAQAIQQNDVPQTTAFQYDAKTVRMDGEIKWQYTGEINGMPFQGVMDEDPAIQAQEEADHPLSILEKQAARRTAIAEDMQAKLAANTQEASTPSVAPEPITEEASLTPETSQNTQAEHLVSMETSSEISNDIQANVFDQSYGLRTLENRRIIREDGTSYTHYTVELNGKVLTVNVEGDPAQDLQEELQRPLTTRERMDARTDALKTAILSKLDEMGNRLDNYEKNELSPSPSEAENTADISGMGMEKTATSSEKKVLFEKSSRINIQDENKFENQPIITGHLDKNGNMTWERTEYGKEQLNALHHPIKAEANGVLDSLKTTLEKNLTYNVQDGENRYFLDSEPFETKGILARNLKIENKNGAVITLPIEEKSYQEALSQKGVSEADIMKKMARDLLQEHPITENMIAGMSQMKTVDMQETPLNTQEVPLNIQETPLNTQGNQEEEVAPQPFLEKMKESVLDAFNRSEEDPLETGKTPEPKEPMEVVDILPMGYGLQKEKELQQQLKEATSNTVKKEAIKPLTGTPLSQGTSQQAAPVTSGASTAPSASSLQDENKEERKGRMASLPHEEISFAKRKEAYEKTEEKMKTLAKSQIKFNTDFETSFDEQKGEIKVHLSQESYIKDDGVETSYFAKKEDDLDIERALKLAMLQKEKGFDSLLINGKKEFQEQMFLASRLVELEVKGYTPSKETLEKLEVLKADEILKKVINVKVKEDMTGSIVGLKNNQTR